MVVERTVTRMVENIHLCEIENMCVTRFCTIAAKGSLIKAKNELEDIQGCSEVPQAWRKRFILSNGSLMACYYGSANFGNNNKQSNAWWLKGGSIPPVAREP